MFYQPGKTPHTLPHDPFKACVVPRPIGWISTISPTHTTPSTSITPEPTANLAPYSQFQNLTFDPPYIMFAANQTPSITQKDTVRNAESTGIFCWQLATYPLRNAVNITSEQLPYGTDEFLAAGLQKTYSTVLEPRLHIPGFRGIPMVSESPVRFECEYHSTLRLPGNPPLGSVDIVIGKVVGVFIDDRVINEKGRVDVGLTEPIARCGYYEYAVVRETFEMKMPGDQIMRDGLEGSMRRNREAGEAIGKVEEGGVAEEKSENENGVSGTASVPGGTSPTPNPQDKSNEPKPPQIPHESDLSVPDGIQAGDTTTLMVPDKIADYVVGRDGETLRDLQERSGCQLVVGEGSVDGMRAIELSGDEASQRMVKEFLMEISRGEGGVGG